MMSFLLFLGMILFGVVSAVSFVLNGSTPVQLGPIPVLGGAALSLVCLIALIARHIVWK